MKHTLIPLLMGVLFTFTGYSQESVPDLDLIWTITLRDAGIKPAELKDKIPSFPYSDSGVEDVKTWLTANSGDTETILGIFESHDFVPSRIQLGLGETPANYRSLLSPWDNALNTYGSVEQALVALPHMPIPSDYCSVSGYELDWKKEGKWRDDQGYGPEADAKLNTENSTDVNDLLNESIFPCLGQYFAAMDYWVYEYPLEYVKLQTECGCGADPDYSTIIILPDSVKPPYVSPMERFAQVPVNENAVGEDEMVYLPMSGEHPIAVLKATDDDLDLQHLEEILAMADGGSKFWDYLKEHTTTHGFPIVLTSTVAYYKKAESSYYNTLKSSANEGEDFFSQLESGELKIVPVSNEEFINLFQTEQE